jgi:hypothetical protein
VRVWRVELKLESEVSLVAGHWGKRMLYNLGWWVVRVVQVLVLVTVLARRVARTSGVTVRLRSAAR